MTNSTPTDSSVPSGADARGLRPGSLIPILTSGLVIGVFQVIFAATLGALVFSGPLSGYVASGIGLALFGAIVAGLVVALFGSLPGTVGGVQDAPAAIMAVMAGAIVVAMPAGASLEATFVTVTAAIAVAAFVTGACLLGLGYFRLGNLVRFLPYPVIGGFLAGTGWLMFNGGLSMMSGYDLVSGDFLAFFEPAALITWLPGLLWAVAVFLVIRRFDHPLLLPALIVLGVMLFYGAAWFAGTSINSLTEHGLLLGPFPVGQLWPPISLADLKLISWPVVFGQALSVATITALSMVGVLLNASGLEVTFGRDMELNQELRAAGAGNLLAGLGGGFVAFQQLGSSSLALRLKGVSRWTGLIVAVACALFLVFGGAALSYFPVGVLGGLLVLLGLTFLFEWLVEARSRLPGQDYVIIVVILLTTAVVGFLQAVILGLLIAVVLFAVSYSRANFVRAELSGATYHSRVSRSRRQQALLDQVADQLVIFQLQGFIFFGTAHSISSQVEQRIIDAREAKPVYVILDFGQVTGLDSTASISFGKLIGQASGQYVTLGIAAPNPSIWRQLVQAGLCEPGDGFKLFSTLDKGVEWCEQQLLAAFGPDAVDDPLTITEQLALILGDADGAASLTPYMERLTLEAGQRIMARGDAADNMYFIESGRVTAQLSSQAGQPYRLQSMGGGNVIGEIGFYLGGNRTADVVADEASVLYRLSLPDLKQIQTNDPQAASTLHRLVAILLAERVAYLTSIADSQRADRE